MVTYSPGLLYTLVILCVVLMLLESSGIATTLALTFKGDVKRETRFLAQYGQSVCTLVVVVLVWRMDRTVAHHWGWLQIVLAVTATSVVAFLVKRLVGRVRPGRPNAGKFLGPTLEHANFRESFPSSHSACAVAFTVVLSVLYPAGASIFWALALICAGLRYIMDAHWPSDVIGGIALGYWVAHVVIR